MKKLLLLLVLSLLLSPLITSSVFAEEGPDLIYLNESSQECGLLWLGDEYEELRPTSSDWDELMRIGDSREAVCDGIVEEYGVNTCEMYDPQEICEALGYTYTDIPYETTYSDLYFGEYQETLPIDTEGNCLEDDCDEKPWILYTVGGILIALGIFFVIRKR